MLTVEIRGCQSPERFAEVRVILGNHPIHQNSPVLYVDFSNRESAHFAVLHLNLIAGIKARIVE